MQGMIVILIRRIAVMFLLILAGDLLFQKQKITNAGSKEMGAVLLYLVMPCVILKSFMTELSREKAEALLISFGLAVGCLLAAILAARVIFGDRHPVEHFGAAFSNAGFIGIPLVSAILGSKATFYITSFIALLNFLQWTYGRAVMAGKGGKVSGKALCTNPILISMVLGMLVFFLKIPVPAVCADMIGLVADMNAPLAMIVLGVYLAQVDIREMLKDRLAYRVSAVRLLLIPAVTLLLLTAVPQSYSEMKMAILLAAAAPIGSNVAIFAQQDGQDQGQAAKEVCLSTILSIFTMPVVMKAAELIW